MEKFNFYISPTFDEIIKKYEDVSFYKDIEKAYKEELPNVRTQIKVNNSGYIDAQVSAAKTMIKGDAFNKTSVDPKVQSFIENVYNTMPDTDGDLIISRSVLENILLGCIEEVEPRLEENKKLCIENGQVISRKIKNIKFNWSFLLQTLNNADCFQKGVMLKHIYWVIIAVLQELVLLRDQATVTFNEKDATVIYALFVESKGKVMSESEFTEKLLKENSNFTLDEVTKILNKLLNHNCIDIQGGKIKQIEKFDF